MGRRSRNPTRFRRLLADNGLTLAAFCRLTGVHLTTASRWANGHLEVPQWVFLVLWLIPYLPSRDYDVLLETNPHRGEEHHGR